jgi:hypothetical protein
MSDRPIIESRRLDDPRAGVPLVAPWGRALAGRLEAHALASRVLRATRWATPPSAWVIAPAYDAEPGGPPVVFPIRG